MISILISNTSYSMKYELNIDIDRIISTTIILEDSAIIILDFHQISKNRRNIYSFMIIHTNTFD